MSPTHAELEITNSEGAGEMVVGKSYPVSCTVHGSRPPPRITWFINSTPLGKLFISCANVHVCKLSGSPYCLGPRKPPLLILLVSKSKYRF